MNSLNLTGSAINITFICGGGEIKEGKRETRTALFIEIKAGSNKMDYFSDSNRIPNPSMLTTIWNLKPASTIVKNQYLDYLPAGTIIIRRPLDGGRYWVTLWDTEYSYMLIMTEDHPWWSIFFSK